MEANSRCFLIIIILPFKILNADEINYLDIVESLDTFKILEELAESLEPDTPCSKDIKEYVNNLMLDKPWALQMYDSSAKTPDGLLLRRKEFFGQFDECITVQHPEGNFKGQYCLLYPTLHLENRSILPEIDQRDEDSSSLLELVYGICLPSTCSLFDIGITLREVFSDEYLKNKISVSTGGYCQTKDSSPKLTTGSWVVAGFLVFVIFIASVSTYFDKKQQAILKTNHRRNMLTFFSIYTNGKELFKISKTSDQLKVLNGIRVLSLCWVIIHNNYGQLPQFSPIVDRIGVYKKRFDYNHVFATNGYLAVDTFFFLSGLLISTTFCHDIAKKGYYDIPLAYIHRYIRLTPPYAVMILITTMIFPYLGNGPIWPQVAHSNSDSCKNNWWAGLLYVQNYANRPCLDHTWYLSADMQLHWISPLILYPLFFWPSLASIFLCIAITGATFVTFMNAYVNNLGPNDEISKNREETKLDYITSHTRAAPWLIGLALGYAICIIKAKKIQIKLPKLWVKSGWLVSAGFFIACLYGPLRFTFYEYTPLEAALFLALYRVCWGLGLAWIVFSCIYGYGGPINAFLSWSAFEPLGKLSYCAFLLHMPFQYYRIGVTRVTFYGSDTETIYFALGDIILSFLTAIPLTLLFEIPFRRMDRYFFQNVKILPYPKRERRKAREN